MLSFDHYIVATLARFYHIVVWIFILFFNIVKLVCFILFSRTTFSMAIKCQKSLIRQCNFCLFREFIFLTLHKYLILCIFKKIKEFLIIVDINLAPTFKKISFNLHLKIYCNKIFSQLNEQINNETLHLYYHNVHQFK